MFVSHDLQAQDIHFSQYNASPLSLNPSTTGLYDADWRVMANYRTQWRSIDAFNTTTMGYDRQFYYYSQKFSGGFYFINDQSGGINLDVNKLYLSAAYHKEVNYHEFHFGVQFGWVFKSIDENKMILPNQFDNTIGYFNPSFNSGEQDFKALNYPDLNLGVSWTKKSKPYESFAGFSLHHIIYPKEAFSNYDNFLHARIGLQGFVKAKIVSCIYIQPSVNLNYHRKAKAFVLGSNFSYLLPNKLFKIEEIIVGTHFRNSINIQTDALCFVFALQFEQLYAGVSYDVNISDLQFATSNRGALEFAIIYTGMITNMVKTAVPCDRY